MRIKISQGFLGILESLTKHTQKPMTVLEEEEKSCKFKLCNFYFISSLIQMVELLILLF